MSYRRCAPWILIVVAALSGVASAQPAPAVTVPAFNLERLELDPFGVGSLALGSGRLLAPGGFRISAVEHYESKPLLLLLGGQRTALIRDRLTTHFTLGFGLHRRVSLGAELPIVTRQTSDDLTALRIPSPPSSGLGTPVVRARFGVLQSVENDPLDLALEVAVGLPVGNGDALAGNSSTLAAPKLLVSRQFDPVLLSIEAGALFQPKFRLGAREMGNQLTFGASGTTVGEIFRAEVSWRSYVSLTGSPAAHEVLGGARLAFGPGLELFALGGPGIGTSLGTPAFRVLLGLAWRSEGRAAKVADGTDVCQPGRTHLPWQCPDLDDDGDGIKNALDKCPLEPEDYDGFQDEDGCPEPDNDGDGIPDIIDRCPNTPGVPELAGCPAFDSGGRGTLDRDRDGDGVPDHLDNCPDEPGPASNRGCPVKEKQLLALTPQKLVLVDKVSFATNKAAILPKSQPLLDQVAQVILAHPELPPIIIEDHSNDRRDAAADRRLSQARANAVRDYLMGKGVRPSRLKAKGYGSDRPLETNVTARGREANRRVEFIIGPPSPDSDILAPLVPSSEPPIRKEKVKTGKDKVKK